MELQPYIVHFEFPNFESQMYWSTVASDDYTNDCHNNRWALDLYTGRNLEDKGNITFNIFVAELSSGDNDHASFYTYTSITVIEMHLGEL